MRVLLVDGYDAKDPDGHLVVMTQELLRSLGHDLEYLSLKSPAFAAFMSEAERRAYETDEPLQANATRDSAAAVKRCEALLFCYPTTLFGVPPRLKSWLERVMVLGVAFEFDKKRRVRPGLRNVRRIGVVTSSPHSARSTRRARDLGYRTLMRTLRLNCHPACRRTFVRIASGAPAGRAEDHLKRQLSRW